MLLPTTAHPLTARAFASLPATPLSEVGGAGGSSLLATLQAQDESLQKLYRGEWPPPKPREFVRVLADAKNSPADVTVDVAVCGGTLGLILACALQLKGHSVAVVEAGQLRGRDQDWNTSEEELLQLVKEGVLDASEVEKVAPLRFGPMSCRFGPQPDFELKLGGVLDVGVSPTSLLECVRSRFEAAGGVVLENSPVASCTVHADGASLALGAVSTTTTATTSSSTTLGCRLVLDAMGHRSPIALQQRAGQRPDGVCVQVGSCARGAWASRWGTSGDFFVTENDAVRVGPRRAARCQYFWQAFPSSGGAEERSTYLFTYLRPGKEMPSLVDIMEDYWQTLPRYQRIGSGADGGVDGGGADPLADVSVQRILFGWFPTYKRNAPLSPAFDRVLSIGDASAVQSPLSFGGFCAMLRHLPRYSRGLDRALHADRLSRSDLQLLAPYLPNLGTAWMSSAAMTARAVGGAAPPEPEGAAERPAEGAAAVAQREPPYTLVNNLLEGNFKVMGSLPRPDALTFFRDVTTLQTLMAVLIGQTATMAPLLPRVVAELVGPLELAEFSYHLLLLSAYTVLHRLAGVSRLGERASDSFELACALDALAYGSGLDSEQSAGRAGSTAALGRSETVSSGER